MVFGLAIIIKNLMEFLSYFQISYVECNEALFYIAPVAQGIFVLAEVNFIFRHSKICMHKSKFMNRYEEQREYNFIVCFCVVYY